MIYVLSGGGNAKVSAFINVTYPAGSTCICTDDSKTLKLKDTSGQGIFYVPYIGQWKVKCYDGADYDSSANKKSAYVEITSDGQSESVTLTYELYLFNNGVVDGIAWEASSKANTASSSVSSTIKLTATSAWAGDLFYSGNAKRGTSSAHNLSGYTTLKVHTANISGSAHLVRLLIGTSQLYGDVLTADLSRENDTTTSVDISAIYDSDMNGSYYISFEIHSNASGNTTLTVAYDKVWLE